MTRPFETSVALRCWIDLAPQNESSGNPVSASPDEDKQSGKGEWRKIKIGEAGLVIDLETTTDEFQTLRVGAFKLLVAKEYSGIFVTDDLKQKDAEGYAIAKQYAEKRGMLFLTRRRFIKEIFHPTAYDIGGLVVGFNLPFDLTRIATSVTASEGEHRDRFRLYFRHHLENPQARPDIGITPLSEHAARIEFLPAAPKGSEKKWLQYFRGRFLDLHQAIYAITGENHNLRQAGQGACEGHQMSSRGAGLSRLGYSSGIRGMISSFLMGNRARRNISGYKPRSSLIRAYLLLQL